MLGELVAHPRVSVRGPHGLGKSTLMAWAILWFALTRDGEDWKVPVTASNWRQLTKYLFPELHRWARLLRWDVIGRAAFNSNELLDLALNLSTGSAFALASDKPESLEGAHADHILYVFDESKSVPSATFDAAEGAFSTVGEVKALAVSTPGEPNGRFYDIHARKPGLTDWWVRHVTKDEAIAAGRMSAEWAEARRTQWGEASEVYQNRVLGIFSTTTATGVIPLAWVEAANNRWLALKDDNQFDRLKFTCTAADIAYGGEDKSVLALRFGTVITEMREMGAGADTMHITGIIHGLLEKYTGYAVVDSVGWGAGVVDRLREQGHKVEAFSAGGSKAIRELTDKSKELKFCDTRSAAWWGLRERLDPQSIEFLALPPNDELTGDLTAPRWRAMSDGRIRIESKDDLRKAARLGRSTDYGDAVIMAFWPVTMPVTRPPDPGRMLFGRVR